MNGTRTASSILVYLVVISIPVNIALGVAPIADILPPPLPQHVSLGGVWVFQLAVWVGLASGTLFCGATHPLFLNLTYHCSVPGLL